MRERSGLVTYFLGFFRLFAEDCSNSPEGAWTSERAGFLFLTRPLRTAYETLTRALFRVVSPFPLVTLVLFAGCGRGGRETEEPGVGTYDRNGRRSGHKSGHRAKSKSRRVMIGAGALASVGAVTAAVSVANAGQYARTTSAGADRAVFVQGNELDGNTIHVFARGDDGKLSPAGEFATGGKGGDQVDAWARAVTWP